MQRIFSSQESISFHVNGLWTNYILTYVNTRLRSLRTPLSLSVSRLWSYISTMVMTVFQFLLFSLLVPIFYLDELGKRSVSSTQYAQHFWFKKYGMRLKKMVKERGLKLGRYVVFYHLLLLIHSTSDVDLKNLVNVGNRVVIDCIELYRRNCRSYDESCCRKRHRRGDI